MNIYIENGYKNRSDYLRCLAEDTGASLTHVKLLSDLLGETEDFDGLVTAVQDTLLSN